MATFFRPNIDRTGRLVRGIGALVLVAAGVIVGQDSLWPGVALTLSGAFVLFEAVRDWCVIRACGIKTRL